MTDFVLYPLMSRFALLTFLLLLLSSNPSTQAVSTVNIRGKNLRLELYGSRSNPPVILTSGDLGWAGLVVHVAEFLSSNGYFVVGVNSRAYLSSFTTKSSTLKPEDVPGDYLQLLAQVRQLNPNKPILSGISEGAGLSVLAATTDGIKAQVRGIMALGLPDQNELGWRWQDSTIWITKRSPNEPSFMVQDIITKVSPVPLAELHSTHDEFLSLEDAKKMFALAGRPKKMWVIEAANHRFSNNREELDRRMLEALDWIKSADR